MKAFFFNVALMGHIKPSLSVVAELVNRGWEVDYYCTSKYLMQIEETGARFIPIDKEDNFVYGMDPILYSSHLLYTTELLLPKLIDDVTARKPDVIITDFLCIWGHVLARIMNIKLVTLNSSMAVSPAMLPPLWFHLCAKFTMRKLMHCIGYGSRRLRLEKKFRVSIPSLNGIPCQVGDINLVMTSPSLQCRPDLFSPDQYHYIGIDGNKIRENKEPGFIYISLGTVYCNADTVLLLAKYLSDMSYTILVSTGGHTEYYQNHPLFSEISTRKNVSVCAFVDQQSVLARCSLFITHGGMNSVNEAILCLTPLLVMPQAADQFLIAEAVRSIGVGQILDPEDVRSPHNLQLQVSAILQSELIHNTLIAERAVMLGLGGSNMAVRKIDHFVRGDECGATDGI